jgi:hypothetical protein
MGTYKIGGAPPGIMPQGSSAGGEEIPHNMQRNEKGVIYIKLLFFSFVRRAFYNWVCLF